MHSRPLTNYDAALGVTGCEAERHDQHQTARDVTAEIAYLTRASRGADLPGIGGPARRAGPIRILDHEDAWRPVCNVRSPPGTRTAAKAGSGPPAPGRSIEEFDFDHARGLKRDLIAHLATLDFVAGKENVIFLGPPRHRQNPS